MNDVADQIGSSCADRSCVVSILPYRLRALRRRQQAAIAASYASGAHRAAPAQRANYSVPETMRTGIRHIASGRMTVVHTQPKTVLAMLTTRAGHRRGLLEDERLEAIVVDERRQVFAGFWP